MSDILSSAAFQEFLRNVYEEKLLKDERCVEINRQILQLEKELIPILSDEAKMKFFEIESLSDKLFNRMPIVFTDKITINTVNFR